MTKIYPKCKMTKNTRMAITWEGYISPCCPMASNNYEEIKELVGGKLYQLHIGSGTLDEINRSEAMYIIEKSFEENPLKSCRLMCKDPIPDLPKDTKWMGGNSPYTDRRNTRKKE